MTVVRIGKVEGRNQRFVTGDQTVTCRLIHPIAGAFEGCSITVRFIAEQGIDPFPMDVSGPLSAEKDRQPPIAEKYPASVRDRECWRQEGR